MTHAFYLRPRRKVRLYLLSGLCCKVRALPEVLREARACVSAPLSPGSGGKKKEKKKVALLRAANAKAKRLVLLQVLSWRKATFNVTWKAGESTANNLGVFLPRLGRSSVVYLSVSVRVMAGKLTLSRHTAAAYVCVYNLHSAACYS